MWQLAKVRFTSFLLPGEAAPSGIWASTLGSEPDNVVQQRQTGIRREAGIFEGAVAKYSSHIDRVDWQFDPPHVPEPRFESLGAYPDAAGRFLTVLRRWAVSPAFPRTRRMAIGVTLVEPVETAGAGFARLRDFVDAVPAGDFSDFLYQINRYRPTTTGVEGLRINRLAKWTQQSVQMVMVNSEGTPAPSPPSHAVVLELDVNTSGDRLIEIPRDEIGNVFDDLWAGVGETSSQRDDRDANEL